MWYLRVSNPDTVARTNCFVYTDSRTYERCMEGGMIVFTDAPDSHHTIDQFEESRVSELTDQLTALEARIRRMQNTVHAPVPPIQITLPRLTPHLTPHLTPRDT